jgi:hypothetical protein
VREPCGGLERPHAEIGAALVGRDVEAERPKALRGVEPGAVRERGNAAVEEEAVTVRDPERALGCGEPGGIEEQGRREADDRGRGARPSQPAPQDEDEDGREERGSDEPCQRREPEQGAGGRDQGRAGTRPPRQQHERADDSCNEERLGQDVVLDRELVTVEQQRSGAERRHPRRDAGSAHEEVEDHREGEAGDVLGDRDRDQLARRQKGLEEHDRVQGRSVATRTDVGVDREPQVGVGVALQEQSGIVGERNEDAKGRSRE